MQPNSTILITAYAVNPFKGSEDGTGWNLICQAARKHKVIAVTRKNNREAIERYFATHRSEVQANIEFQYFDLPAVLRFWKKIGKLYLVYCYLWQLLVPLFIKYQKLEFDVAHNLNFHSDSHPTFLWMLGKPVVWGPVGHHPPMPAEALKQHAWKIRVADRANYWVKRIARSCDPFFRIAVKKAHTILTVHRGVGLAMDAKPGKLGYFPAIGAERQDEQPTQSTRFDVLSVGRFVPMKGFDLALRAFAHFYHQLDPAYQRITQLTLVGEGPEEAKLRALTNQLNIADAVEFVDWVPRNAMRALYSNASAFLFPSHEGAGMVVPEALSYGLPVVCLRNHGPGELTSNDCAFRVPLTTMEKTSQALGNSLLRLFDEPIKQVMMSRAAVRHFNNTFAWDAKGEQLHAIYNTALKSAEAQTQPKAIIGVHLLNDYSGSPLVFSQVLNGFTAEGRPVELITSEGSAGFLSDLPGVRYRGIKYTYSRSKLAVLGQFLLAQVRLFAAVWGQRKQDAVVYVNTILPAGAALAGWLTGKKVVYHIHETSVRPAALKRLLFAVVRLTASDVIYVSDYLREAEPVTGVRMHRVYNAISTEFVAQAASHQPTRHGGFNVLMLCSLKAYKGVYEFVQLACMLPEIQFTLVLNASRHDILASFREVAKIPSNIKILPAQSDVHRFYREANLVVNLSHPDQWVETFGMTVLEAMHYGVPVIVPPVGGIAELVGDRVNGFKQDVRDLWSVMNRIREVARDQELFDQLSANCRERAGTFSVDRMCARVSSLV